MRFRYLDFWSPPKKKHLSLSDLSTTERPQKEVWFTTTHFPPFSLLLLLLRVLRELKSNHHFFGGVHSGTQTSTHTHTHSHARTPNVPFPFSFRAVRTSRPFVRFLHFLALNLLLSWGYRNRHTTLGDTLAPRATKGVFVVVPQTRGSCHQNLWHASSAVVSVVVVPCRLSIIVRQIVPE